MLGNLFNWKNAVTVLFGSGEIINAIFPTIPAGIAAGLAVVVRALFPTSSK